MVQLKYGNMKGLLFIRHVKASLSNLALDLMWSVFHFDIFVQNNIYKFRLNFISTHLTMLFWSTIKLFAIAKCYKKTWSIR